MPDSTKKEIKTVVVFCGSKFGNSPEYQRDAEALGRLLGQNGFDLVYGGGTAGLMGVVSRTAHENGSKVTGVITEAFRKAVNYNFLHGADEQIVRTLPSRKARMLKQADACYYSGRRHRHTGRTMGSGGTDRYADCREIEILSEAGDRS
jgi:predicted Rossmann-fold nucleotide-binding protein